MRLLRRYADIPEDLRRGVVVLGNLDGVHRGHQQVIGGALADAAALGAPVMAITFEPHPRRFFAPDQPPFRLTPLRSKAAQLAALGVETMIVLAFDTEMSRMPAESFVEEVLVEGVAAKQVTVGYDFRFGHRRRGDVALLQGMAAAGGFAVKVIDPVASADGEVYSSTRIREFLAVGKPGHAAALLGRPFEIEGRVEKGDRRGRSLGFPTANLDLDEYQRPAYGVYAVRAGLGDGETPEWFDGVANLGVRPTVDGGRLLLETHLFDFDRDVYGQLLRIGLIEFIRPERRFDGLDALRAQIAEDSAAARRILRTRAAGAS